MPSGAPFAGFHFGNRLSSGDSIRLPSGVRPTIASSSMADTTSLRPSTANRVSIRMAPSRPSAIMKLVGSASRPSVFDRTKNIPGSGAG